MKTCTDRRARRAMKEQFEGTLDAAGFSRLRVHVAGCAECRERYERLARVESVLERNVLSSGRRELLAQELFARLEHKARSEPRRFSWPSLWLPSLAGAAVATVAAVLLVPRGEVPEPEWSARGGSGAGPWGVRAFCVGPTGDVREEARSGEALACGEGSSVQFSYTAPEPARLLVETTSATGELLRFFPVEGDAREVSAGVDIPLPHSTPVLGSWLSSPLEVRASFSDARGRVLSQTRITLVPALR